MIAAEVILVALLKLPRCYKERNDSYFPTYIANVAKAISEEVKDVDEAAAIATIGAHESAYCMRVQERYTGSAAYGFLQLEGKRHLYPQPFIGLEISSIRNTVFAGVDIWRRTWNCGPGFANRMTSYAGRQCGTKWKTLNERVNTYWYLRSVMVREIKNNEDSQD